MSGLQRESGGAGGVAALLLAYFGAVAMGLAQPAYAWALRYSGRMRLEPLDLLLVVGLLHLAPALALAAARVTAGRAGLVVDALVYGGMGLSVLRQAHLAYLSSEALAPLVKLALALGASAAVMAMLYTVRRHLRLFMACLGLASICFDAREKWTPYAQQE